MMHQAAICKAYFTKSSELARGPGSALVGQLLGDVAGESVCVLEIERVDGRFSLVLDSSWAELGLQVAGLPPESTDELFSAAALPRSVVQAVVAGWPEDWDDSAHPRMGVHLSDDMIPHVSLSEIGVLREQTPGAQPAH